jgi:hypothetical protein
MNIDIIPNPYHGVNKRRRRILMELAGVSDPDSYKIRIQAGKNDPLNKKTGKNFQILKCWMFSLDGWRRLLL